ncbi:DUF6894 family protein [Methylobacterium gnaphalii]|uniref:DUF6894 domain-containing protein n=1 Tax=Methylobacterium gnaphalii TaxID=1010610 RepID=A0A512JMA6_9HYPH|nr:hypothetical protein [Methylobacterium gnaphalii]GEP11100.1 hypothetical protein MGN01_29450 [Methylobacterium gnaphalii]GLS50378.1 hypothetical protein GCM10007885_32300 [Methylobacterium gnaphalii]
MPRYHFNVFDGRKILDPAGQDLTDANSAQVEAIMVAGEIIKDYAKHIALGEDWHMEVTDDTGLILFRLDFQITVSPAVTSA